MAVLTPVSPPSVPPQPLRARTLVGRAPHCDVVLTNRKASSEHAVLVWEGGQWSVRDLSSRNGTWTARERLASGGRAVLRAGDQLFFGSSSEAWQLGAGGPEVFAVPVGGGAAVVGEAGMLALPDAESAQLTVYQNDHGQWRSDDGVQVLEVHDGAVVTVGPTPFRLSLPHVLPPTEDGELSLYEARFDFAVSADEEYVELALHQGVHTRTVAPRAHLYVLLTLARLRLEQEADGTHGEAGWVHQEDLARMLGCPDGYVNLAIYKARRQLAKVGLVGAPGVVERRVGTRQLRFGTAQVTVRTL